jgi:hypothetical protein
MIISYSPSNYFSPISPTPSDESDYSDAIISDNLSPIFNLVSKILLACGCEQALISLQPINNIIVLVQIFLIYQKRDPN